MTPSSGPSVTHRLAASSYVPHQWCRRLLPAPVWNEFATAFADSMTREASLIESSAGTAAWRMLGWDSEQLGMPVARVDAILPRTRATDDYGRLAGALIAEASAAGVRYLTARIDASELACVHTLEQLGFQTIDGILTLGRVSDSPPTLRFPDGAVIREATQDDADLLAAEGAPLFTLDRFHGDPKIPAGRADALHETWLRNSCGGGAADVTWLMEDEAGSLLGFTTAKLNRLTRDVLGFPILTIVLVGTTERARRRGVARALSELAVAWSAERGIRAVEVGTQLRNVPAARTYESAGYRLVATSLTLRRWLEE